MFQACEPATPATPSDRLIGEFLNLEAGPDLEEHAQAHWRNDSSSLGLYLPGTAILIRGERW